MFDTSSRDSQGTDVIPIAPELFDLEKYAQYTLEQEEKVKKALRSSSGSVLVYRRFRVPEVYSSGCKNMANSWSLQLGALHESMNFKADFANFLEPWYGIGTFTAPFGGEYVWKEGQAPAVIPPFNSIKEALNFDIRPVSETEIGRTTLEYIDYFLDKTQKKIPMSFSDIQSPINAASLIVPVSNLFLDMVDNPDEYQVFIKLIANLTSSFLEKEKDLLGDTLVFPGHGFASSRQLRGIGISDDNSVMVSNRIFEKNEVPVRELLGEPFGGVAFHSCGNWEKKIPAVLKIRNLVCVDGAFTGETDPDPNPTLPFAEAFAENNIWLHIRVVGKPDEIIETVRQLWRPNMKLIVCTYCKTPEEQAFVYNRIHEICQ